MTADDATVTEAVHRLNYLEGADEPLYVNGNRSLNPWQRDLLAREALGLHGTPEDAATTLLAGWLAGRNVALSYGGQTVHPGNTGDLRRVRRILLAVWAVLA